MKKITFLLIALLVAMVSYSQVFFEENFNGTTEPANWYNFAHSPAHGSQIWEFGSGVTPGTDIADFSSNAAIFDDPTGVNVAYLYHFPVDIITIMSDVDYSLIYSIRTSLNTFGSDPNPDRLSIKVSDESFDSSNNIIWHTNTEHNPTQRNFDIKAFLQASSWNLDYSEFRIGVEFNDMDGTNGWGAGIDDVSLYARQYNDDLYASLPAPYNITSLPYFYEQKADNQANFSQAHYPSNVNTCSNPMTNGLWYKYVADFTGKLTVHGRAYDYDSQVNAYVYNASTSEYDCAGAIDGYGSGRKESLIIDVIQGKTYAFEVGYWSGSGNASSMHGNQYIAVSKTPNNDACVDAINFTNSENNYTHTADTLGATNNSGYVTTCGPGMNDGVWYKFTPTISGEYNFDITTSYNAEIGIYTGSCTNLTCVGNVDADTVGGGNESYTTNVVAGTQYWINIGHSDSNDDFLEGDLTVNFYYTPPANDDCVDATSLTVGTNFDQHDVIAKLLGCTATPGITSISCTPAFGFGNGNDIWYKLTVPSNGAVTIETAAYVGSTLSDTVLAAYTGPCNNLQEVACNDDGAIGHFTKLDVTGQAPGSILYIRASEYHTNNFDRFRISAYDLSTSAVENDIIEGLSLYPNPVSDVLQIDAQDNITSLVIYNQLGQIVKKTMPNQTKITMDVSDLATGLYMVEVKSNDKKSIKKLIKK